MDSDWIYLLCVLIVQETAKEKKKVWSLHPARITLYFSFNILRKHKFAALTVKGNFHSCLELRLCIVCNEFHWTYAFSDFGLDFKVLLSVKGKEWRSLGRAVPMASVSLVPILLLS